MTSPVQDPALSAHSSANSLRYKNSELLKVTRELVLPLHMKQLLEQAKFIDDSLNFLKRCRHKDESGILFSELKASVAKSYHRSITEDNFRQLLTVVPDFYSHNWEKGSSTRHAQLSLDFESDAVTIKNINFFR